MMIRNWTVAVAMPLALASSAFAQQYVISTYAGGAPPPTPAPGTAASIGESQGVATDAAGNVYFSSGNNCVFKLDLSGVLTRVAGTCRAGYSGDGGPATSAQLFNPYGVAVDSAGNLFIADLNNGRIRKVTPAGIISTVAGNGISGYSGDGGLATSAQLTSPYGVAVDSAGNLYIADVDNGRIRRVTPTGVINTLAGNGGRGFSGDGGPATSAQFDEPAGMAVDSAGNLYIADTGNKRIRKVTPTGTINTVAGNGSTGFSGDGGPATSAQLSLGYPNGVAVDSDGNLYIADSNNSRIRKVTPAGVINTVGGNGSFGYSGDGGPATSAQLDSPIGVAVDNTGNLYIAEYYSRIRRVTLAGIISTAAGNGTESYSGDGGPATNAQLFGPSGVAVDSAGNLYIADSNNSRIRKVTPVGVINTVAGNGSFGYSGDGGSATSAQLFGPSGVAVDSAGNLYIADYGNFRIRKVTPAGVISTVAGNGSGGYSGDGGPATSAQVNAPNRVAVDNAGNLYIADSFNYRIRKVTAAGIISTIAGNGTQGYSGDGGPATSAQLNHTDGIAVDTVGNLFIADGQNNSIRKVTAGGIISTVAGNGNGAYFGDGGPATSAQLFAPQDVAVDSAGNLYIADVDNGRIRKVTAGGIISTAAGNGNSGYSGDGGPATSAQLNVPSSVAVSSAGKVYIADTNNNAVRLLQPTDTSCTYSVDPTSSQVPASGGAVTVDVQTDISCPWSVSGLPNWITTATTSGSGPGGINLVVSPNSAGAQSATVLIAGTQVTISQAAAPSACSYSINPGGQGFTAAGGTGSISVTTDATCTWTAVSSASWITLTGAASGTGNGTVTYQVAANSGAAQSSSIAVAGLSFVVDESAATVTGLTSVGSMAQIASAGYWSTRIVLINTGSTAAQTRLTFFGNDGSPLTLPLTFPQSPATAGPLLASTFDSTIGPGAQLVVQTTGPTAQPVVVGWAQVQSNGTLGGDAVFSFAGSGSIAQDAVAPLENRNANGYIVGFDNTGGSNDGIAIANLTNTSINTAITIRDDQGAVILSDTLTLPGTGHTSFDLTDRYGSVTAQRRGTLEFRPPGPGQITILGIHANPTGGYSDIPAVAE